MHVQHTVSSELSSSARIMTAFFPLDSSLPFKTVLALGDSLAEMTSFESSKYETLMQRSAYVSQDPVSLLMISNNGSSSSTKSKIIISYKCKVPIYFFK